MSMPHAAAPASAVFARYTAERARDGFGDAPFDIAGWTAAPGGLQLMSPGAKTFSPDHAVHGPRERELRPCYQQQSGKVLLSRANYLTIRASLDRAAATNSQRLSRRRTQTRDGKLVHSSGFKRLATPPTAGGQITRQACALVKAAGIELPPLLAKAGLTVEQIKDRDARFPVQSQIRFLELAADALHDEFLGFHLALDFELREMGLLYYVLASSERLGDSLHRAARYSSLGNEGISLRFRDERDAAMTFDYVGVARHSDRQQIEYWLTAVIRVCRQLTNRHLVPTHARLIHRRTEHASGLSSFLGCDVAFEAEVDEIVFPENAQDMPVVGGDPYLNKLLVKYCEEALVARGARGRTLRTDLENAIVPLLPHGKAHAGEIARRLGMSRRTLARRLSAKGLTFAGILADLRVDLGERHLRDGDLAISQVAWLLGYREVSAFTHAFRRWTGKTPRQVRIQQAPPHGDEGRKSADFRPLPKVRH
jgi:AraC-like DNA-binding protein